MSLNIQNFSAESQAIISVISEFCEVEDNVALAVSGGPDSMALAAAFSIAFSGVFEGKKTKIHAFTINHRLRPESRDEAEQAGQWLSKFPNIQHHILDWAHDGMTTRIQEDARAARYQLLKKACLEKGLSKIFLGHHRDDQAETILFRLSKGTGLDGLAGMKKSQDIVFEGHKIQIIRPFLDLPKSALLSFCKECDIPYVEDPSNENAVFARVRLRQSAEALSKEGLTPERLALTASRIERAREALDFYTEQLFQEALISEEKTKICFDLKMLDAAPDETLMRVLIKAINQITRKENDHHLRLERVETLHHFFFTEKKSSRKTLGGCILARSDKNNLFTVECE